MDVGRNLALKSLYCESNELSSLDVGGCPALKELWCSNNELASLDVSKNPVLEYLDCCGNQLFEPSSGHEQESKTDNIQVCSTNQQNYLHQTFRTIKENRSREESEADRKGLPGQRFK